MREFRPRKEEGCDVPLVSAQIFLAVCISHIKDGKQHRCRGYASTLFRIYGVQRGLCRTSRSVGSLAVYAPHRTYRPLVSDSRGANTVAWVSSALFHLTFGHKKSPRRIAPTKAFCILFVHYNYIILAI